MASHYKIGSMDIREQSKTFDAFINWSVWGGLLVGLGVFGLVLVFGAHMSWLLVTFLMVALGVIAGFVLKMPASWYATLAGTFVFALLAYFVAALVVFIKTLVGH